MSGAKDLRFICREFHKRGDELRNERSANSWNGKAQMIRGTSSAGEGGGGDIYEPLSS